MQIKRIDSIPVVTLSMKIGEMRNDGSFVTVLEHDSPLGFWISVPRHIAKKLNKGDDITAVCILTPSMKFGTETLALKKKTGEHSQEIIFDRSDYMSKPSDI